MESYIIKFDLATSRTWAQFSQWQRELHSTETPSSSNHLERGIFHDIQIPIVINWIYKSAAKYSGVCELSNIMAKVAFQARKKNWIWFSTCWRLYVFIPIKLAKITSNKVMDQKLQKNLF